jgi:hypothetical protein
VVRRGEVVRMWLGIILCIVALALLVVVAVMRSTGPRRPRHGDKPTGDINRGGPLLH